DRRHIDRMRAVAARAAQVDHRRGVERDLRHARPHRARRAHALFERLALHAHRRQQPADLRRRRLAVHDLADHRRHLVGRQVAPLDDPRERVPDPQLRFAHGRPPFAMKFASRSLPALVRNDSGWNCTPSTGSVLWRTAMISFSPVHAVTSRQAGTVARSISSEWYRVASNGFGRPANTPLPSWWMGDVFPCMTRAAR